MAQRLKVMPPMARLGDWTQHTSCLIEPNKLKWYLLWPKD